MTRWDIETKEARWSRWKREKKMRKKLEEHRKIEPKKLVKKEDDYDKRTKRYLGYRRDTYYCG